jgi:Stress responsive A/B Barrel Domain
VIAHIVLFEPKSETTHDQRRSFARILQSCSREIPSIKRASVGRANRINQTYLNDFGSETYRFDYAAVIEFDDQAGLELYLNHQLHKEMAAQFWQLCERTVIVDIEMSDARSDDIVGLLV